MFSMNINVDIQYAGSDCASYTQRKSGCLYVELHLISDSNYVSESSPRACVMASFHRSTLCLLNSAACLPSVLRTALCWAMQRHFSALLMQLWDADKGDDCSSWLWRHVGTRDLDLHRTPLKKRLWRHQEIKPCCQSHKALSSGCYSEYMLWSGLESENNQNLMEFISFHRFRC